MCLLVRGYFNQPGKRFHSSANETLGRLFIVFLWVSKSFCFSGQFVSRQVGYRVRFQANKSQNTVDTLTFVFSFELFACYSFRPCRASGGPTCGSTAHVSVAPCCDTAAWTGLTSSDFSSRHLCHKINELATNPTCPPGISALFGWMKMDCLKTVLCFKRDHRQESLLKVEFSINEFAKQVSWMWQENHQSFHIFHLKINGTRENRR